MGSAYLLSTWVRARGTVKVRERVRLALRPPVRG